jgi:hypothetical protein
MTEFLISFLNSRVYGHKIEFGQVKFLFLPTVNRLSHRLLYFIITVIVITSHILILIEFTSKHI